jgi:hypothetical protein
VRENRRKHYAANPEKIKENNERWRANHPNHRIHDPVYRRECHLMKEYGITVEEYEKMSIAQNNVCVICSGDNSGKVLHVDHDHNTGEVRGLLCNGCNTALGMIHDNPLTALGIYKYLAPMGGLEHLFEIKQMTMEFA